MRILRFLCFCPYKWLVWMDGWCGPKISRFSPSPTLAEDIFVTLRVMNNQSYLFFCTVLFIFLLNDTNSRGYKSLSVKYFEDWSLVLCVLLIEWIDPGLLWNKLEHGKVAFNVLINQRKWIGFNGKLSGIWSMRLKYYIKIISFVTVIYKVLIYP